MAEDLLDFIEGAAGIDQEGCVQVPKIMDAQLRQPSLPAKSAPDLVDRRIGLAGLAINEQVIELAFGGQLVQDVDRAVIQGH